MMDDQTPAIGIFRLFYLHSFVAIRNEPIPHLQFVHTEYVMCFSLALARSVYAYNTDKMCEMKLHTSKTFKQQQQQRQQQQQKQEKQKIPSQYTHPGKILVELSLWKTLQPVILLLQLIIMR